MKTLDELKYAPFHNHTSYSDGFPTVIKSVNQAVKCNLPGLGITDHGTCAGIPEHWMCCNEHNIKPILGSEIYLRIPESWQELGESRNSKSGRYHATLITTNFEGYKRLIAINNAAHRNMEESRGKKYPITTIDMLQEYAGEGLIALTGCVASVTFHDQILIAEEYVN
ncbi:MAG TPA: PHP domain-containing protein, partial [Taishania sp.]|nr:PHP domain-containing protein [Taishania sp.]